MVENLATLDEELLAGKCTIEKAMETISSADFKHLLYGYANTKNTILSEEQKQEIRHIINILQFVYNYSGEDFESVVPNYLYDSLYELMVYSGMDEIVTVKSAEEQEEHHKYPILRGTLDKIYYLNDNEPRTNPTRKRLSEWVASRSADYKRITGKEIDLWDEEIYVFPKWDGVSAVFEFNKKGEVDKVLSRGFTTLNTAKNITAPFKHLKREDDHKKYGLKTELMMTETDLKKYNKEHGTKYQNSRAIVAGFITSIEPDSRADYIVIQPLRYAYPDSVVEEIAEEAFRAPYIRCRLKDIEQIEKFANKHKYVNDLRCDGAVLHIINPEIQKILGRKDDKNKFEVAYKFTEESGITKLENIVFQLGLFGRITPVAIISPITLKGNKIQRVSLGSMERFNTLQLRKNDEVKILYDIVPYLTIDSDCKRSNKGIIQPPKKCTECGEPLEWSPNSAYLSCENPECPCRIKGKILNFIINMNIMNLSYETVGLLYDKGLLCSIVDLYHLKKKKKEIKKLKRLGELSTERILSSIELHRTVYDDILFGSIGIPNISTKTFTKVFSKYSVDELLDIVSDKEYEKLVKIDGIGDSKARDIINGIHSNKKLIRELLKELRVVHKNVLKTNPKVTVCFTNIRDKPLEAFIESHGGVVTDNLTKNTSLLVIPDGKTVSSKKTEKAEKNKVLIKRISDAKEYLKKLLL